MYNLKNKSNTIFFIGLLSYLYLFSSLLNKKYNIVFIYFIILFLGYFIIGNKIFLYNLFIIIIDIITNKLILREGNFESKFEKGKEKSKESKNYSENGDYGHDEDKQLDEDESDKLTKKENHSMDERKKLDFKKIGKSNQDKKLNNVLKLSLK